VQVERKGIAALRTDQIGEHLLFNGDCIEVMETLKSFGLQYDAVVTDPPYHLASIVKRFGKEGAAPVQEGSDGLFARASKGFMGKDWDGGDISYDPKTWRAAYDVLKPGAHLIAFGGTKSFHRIAVAIEDAGFELRDTLMWIYGTGFPKSHDVAKGIDKHLGTPGAIIPTGDPVARMIPGADQDRTGSWIKDNGRLFQPGEYLPSSTEARVWQGWGTALKPAFEPIIIARRPLEGTVAQNVLKYGTGAINIDGCRVEPGERVSGGGRNFDAWREGEGRNDRPDTHGEASVGHDRGRWPANVLHDGSDEVIDAFPIASGQVARARTDGVDQNNNVFGALKHFTANPEPRGDSGSAARFFYSAKASAKDRAGSLHPTVKPVALMQWLIRLVAPPGATILDPFAGSGTTGAAAALEKCRAVLIEKDENYYADIVKRMSDLP